MSRRRNSDSFVKTLKQNTLGNTFGLVHTSNVSQRLQDFVLEAVNARQLDDDCIANGGEILCKVYPHLSDAIYSFYKEVYGFVRQLQARSLNLGGVEGITGSDEYAGQKATSTLSPRSWGSDRESTNTTEVVDGDVAEKDGILKHQSGEHPYTWLQHEESNSPCGNEYDVNSVEEYHGCDSEGCDSEGCDSGARESVASAQDTELEGSSYCETAHEPIATPATEYVASGDTDADESIGTDDIISIDDQPDSIVSAEMPIQSEQDKQAEENYDGNEDEGEYSEDGGAGVDDHSHTLSQQAHTQQARQYAKKKRRATNRVPQRKRLRISQPEENPLHDGAANKQVQAPDPTGVPGLSLVDLPALPHGTIEPRTVYSMLQDRCQGQPHEDLLFLTRLFFSLGSPSTVVQLKDAILMIRRQTISPTQNGVSEMAHISHWLDQIELCAPLRRRYALVRLLERRRELETCHNDQNGIRRSSRQRKPGNPAKDDSSSRGRHDGEICLPINKADVAALNDLVEECYPCLHKPVQGSPDPQDGEFMRKKKQIQYRLSAARNYTLLQKAVSIGAVALIPIDGISVARLERLSEPVFTTFLEVLQEKRGRFLRSLTVTLSGNISDLLWQRDDTEDRYKFEVMERQNLAQTAFDTAGLISACQFE